MPNDEPSSATVDPDDPWIGQTLAGYTILQRLGEGGMGVIYLARHNSLERLAAIKFLPAEIARDEVFVDLFLREAKAAAKLSHPNIVGVHDAGSLGEGLYYFIMEYVNGRDLRSILDESGPLPVHDAANYVRQAARALGYAHKQHLIHRDIKPENLLLTAEGTIKIVDLGLAKWAGEESSMLTQSGDVLGSPAYISPERLRDPQNPDQRTDIYSLGGSFFHLVTGKAPYEGTPPVVMAQHLMNPVPDPRGVNPAVDEGIAAIIMKMMAKDPTERFQTMEELEAALGAILDGKKKPSDSAPAQKHPRDARKDRWIAVCAILATVMAAITLVTQYWNPLEMVRPTPTSVAPAGAQPAPRLNLADFNQNTRENNLSGRLGSWNSHAPEGECSERIATGAGPDGSNCWSIQVGTKKPNTYGGVWMDLGRIDGTRYDTLSFMVKTDREPIKFLVECKIQPGDTLIAGKQVPVTANNQWKEIQIPLKSFAMPTLASLGQFVFIFNQETTGARDAVVLIDDIALSKK